MPRDLAAVTRRAAHSRTCDTEPGAEPISGWCTVWMESTTTTVGSISSMKSRMWGSEVSDASHRLGRRVPRRSARSRTCCLDSSAET